MKIEEAKEYVEENTCEGYFENQVVMPKEEILALLDQLDQPRTILKKEHAKWLEELKNEFSDDLPNQLYHVTRHGWGYGLEFKSTREQKIKILPVTGGKIKKDLVNALIYGYEVEKEKLYTVEIPNPNSKGKNKIFLCSDNNTGKVYLCKGNFNPKKNKNLMLTEAEIRKDFDWAFRWAKEVTE